MPIYLIIVYITTYTYISLSPYTHTHTHRGQKRERELYYHIFSFMTFNKITFNASVFLSVIKRGNDRVKEIIGTQVTLLLVGGVCL